jgi:D-lyxose ketol-isomerase
MKRSEINRLVESASRFFAEHSWALPPAPKWDVTDFGLGEWKRYGLVLVNLAEEPEYCEKLMYARQGMTTPAHSHRIKKEDIICRVGTLGIRIWPSDGEAVYLSVNGVLQEVRSGQTIRLSAGERVTLTPGIVHEFAPESAECIIGEVSTANDDLRDNFFVNPDVGRFSQIDEDEPAIVRLVSDSE